MEAHGPVVHSVVQQMRSPDLNEGEDDGARTDTGCPPASMCVLSETGSGEEGEEEEAAVPLELESAMNACKRL